MKFGTICRLIARYIYFVILREEVLFDWNTSFTSRIDLKLALIMGSNLTIESLEGGRRWGGGVVIVIVSVNIYILSVSLCLSLPVRRQHTRYGQNVGYLTAPFPRASQPPSVSRSNISGIFLSHNSPAVDSEEGCLRCPGSSKLTDADNDFRQDNIDNIIIYYLLIRLCLSLWLKCFTPAGGQVSLPPPLSSILGCEVWGAWLGWEAAAAFLMRRPTPPPGQTSQPLVTGLRAANSFIAHYRGFMFSVQKLDS